MLNKLLRYTTVDNLTSVSIAVFCLGKQLTGVFVFSGLYFTEIYYNTLLQKHIAIYLFILFLQ